MKVTNECSWCPFFLFFVEILHWFALERNSYTFCHEMESVLSSHGPAGRGRWAQLPQSGSNGSFFTADFLFYSDHLSEFSSKLHTELE